ncbi:uncharacterized protein V6R79_023221 [Siganus canaliculatus]
MAVSSETKLNPKLTSSYNSCGGSPPLADSSSPSDLNKNHGLSNGKKTDEDHSSKESLKPVYVVAVTVALGVTVAMMVHIYLRGNLMFVKGVLVSDHEYCTMLGQRVLHERGSSVDAAITATLCLAVVHPHVSGVGGGGVMLVHNIRRNETRVIDFQGSAPKSLGEKMLQDVSEVKDSSWECQECSEDYRLLTTCMEAEALLKIRGEELPQRFRDVFFPDGQPLHPGSFLKMPSLAGVLQSGLSNFYDGTFSREMEEEVRANGGVLSRDDLSNYRVQVQPPVEDLFNGFIVKVPPPPSVGEALILALRMMEGFHLNQTNLTATQTRHWDAEVSDGWGEKPELLSGMLSKSLAQRLHQTSNYSTIHLPQTEPLTGHVVVMGPDNLMVSVASSLSRLFGSRILTRSGIILNSIMIDLFQSNKTGGQLSTQQKSSMFQGKKPLSFLMPIIVVPAWNKCSMHLALSTSSGHQSLNMISQVITALIFSQEKNDSLSIRSLHPHPVQSRPHVDCK